MLARAQDSGDWPARFGIACACLLLGAALFIEWKGHWQTGLRPADTSYGALVYTMIALEGQLVATAVIMGFYTIARSVVSKLTATRRGTFDNTMLFCHYTVGQGLVGLLIVHGFPRIAG